MLRNIFTKLESAPLTITSALTALLGLTLIRTLLEDITYRTTTTHFTSDAPTLVHYAIFYFTAVIGLAVILHFGSRRPAKNVVSVTFLCATIIITPPLMDLFLFRGSVGNQISYIMTDFAGLWRHFYTLYHFHELPGMSTGIRIEFFIILSSAFLYTFTWTKSLTRSFFTSLATPVFLFIIFTLPSLIFLESGKPASGLYHTQTDSLLKQNFLHSNVSIPSTFEYHTYLANGSMSIVLFLMLLPLLSILFWRLSPRKILAVLRNTRPERIVYYFTIITLGLLVGSTVGLPLALTWLNIGSLICLYLAFLFACLFVLGCNDLTDIDSDAISNKTRPLVTGALTQADVKNANIIFFILALTAGFLAGTVTFFMVLVFIALYHVYSMPPLHLKRFMGINSFIIGLCALTTFIAGYSTLSGDKTVAAIPLAWMLLIVGFFALIANIKDIKDVAGDSATGVYTIPVVFGEKRGKLIISGLVALALSLPPLILAIPLLWLLVPPFALAARWLIHKNPFTERHLFFLYYLYIFLVVAVLI